MDFTLKQYKALLTTLKEQGYSFYSFAEFLLENPMKAIILRHDVDKLPKNSLEFAKIQAEVGIRGSYYFRIEAEPLPVEIIRNIADLGHEVGYHYEDVSIVAKKRKYKKQMDDGEDNEKYIVELAIARFNENLGRIRQIVPIKTICMHGSPMSNWDNRLLWKYYDYRDFGLIGEPYFDINFDDVLYLTDTGRRWDGEAYILRDKVMATSTRCYNQNNNATYQQSMGAITFRSTFDIINASSVAKLPDKMMITFHPQRWTDNYLLWLKELLFQNVKNQGKLFLIKRRNLCAP